MERGLSGEGALSVLLALLFQGRAEGGKFVRCFTAVILRVL